MSEYFISQVFPSDNKGMAAVEALLVREGIKKDGNLDYTCAMHDENGNVIGTGSCFGNTLRCLAVDSSHQGEGLLNAIVSHLVSLQYERGNMHLFLYTKTKSTRFFRDLGFHEITRVEDTLVFMENRKSGFPDYLEKSRQESSTTMGSLQETPKSKIGALVMNANPFTLGHQYLVGKAASDCDLLHLFVVSEDASLFPFPVRKRLIAEGTAQFSNVILHETGSYMVSTATFPSYFLKDELSVIREHARLDVAIFARIATALGINIRYVGDEPTSLVTGMYNKIMSEELPKVGVECHIYPRIQSEGKAISASTVRLAIQNDDFQKLRMLVPETTYQYLVSEEAKSVIEKIKQSGDVVHY